MVITCPNCHTQFNLPDERYMPGRKARCSVCSHYFILMAKVIDNVETDELQTAREQAIKREEARPEAVPTASGGKAKKALLSVFLLIIMAGLGSGAYWLYMNKFTRRDEPVDPVAARIADVEKVRDLLLMDVRHRYVQNVKLGPLVVITGAVRNNFSTPKEKIRVEAALLDKEGKVLAVQQQYCGIMLTDMQLEILGKRELDQALTDSFLMLANNINILPGKSVSFMVVFVYPPTSMSEYSVMVADVSDPPNLNAPVAR